MGGAILALALASVALSAAAQLMFKLGMGAPAMQAAIARGAAGPVLGAVLASPWVIGGLALYGVGTVAWLAVLSRAALSQAYPFVGLSFVATAVLGVLVLGEAMPAARVAGIALIVAGVVLVGRS